MRSMNCFLRGVVLVVALVMLSLTGWSQSVHAQAAAIDPQAEKIL